MNAQAKTAAVTAALTKTDPTTPALLVTYPDIITIKAGTAFAGRTFEDDLPIAAPAGGYTPGADYGIVVGADTVEVVRLSEAPTSEFVLGGFHFALGGNASARVGGVAIPQINPCSLWDCNFRPACPDPRGMTLVEAAGGKFWCDIYLLGQNHDANGTSCAGVTIADGNDPPNKPNGKAYSKLDYATAVAVMEQHGKGLLSLEEFFAAAFGVTEKSSADNDPRVTGLDAERTSKWGVMQATGNMWVWGHDGDPDEPRAALFGGSWLSGAGAGSRYATVGGWPGGSSGGLGARGRGDHLQLA